MTSRWMNLTESRMAAFQSMEQMVRKTEPTSSITISRASLVGRKGSADGINLTQKKFWPLDVTYFVTFDEQQHDLRFLYYLLKTLELTKLAKGVKPGINRNEVYSQVTRVPPLPEQQRIVGLSTKRLTASPPPKPTPKRTSKTPAPSSKATCNPFLQSAARGG